MIMCSEPQQKKSFSSNYWNPQFPLTAAALSQTGQVAVSQRRKRLQGHEKCISHLLTVRAERADTPPSSPHPSVILTPIMFLGLPYWILNLITVQIWEIPHSCIKQQFKLLHLGPPVYSECTHRITELRHHREGHMVRQQNGDKFS